MKRLMLFAALGAALTMSAAPSWARGGGHSGSGKSTSTSHSLKASSSGDHYTHGYYRKDGTYVDGYHATNPNSTRNDNYSTRGNTNPYTGEPGTKPRDREQ